MTPDTFERSVKVVRDMFGPAYRLAAVATRNDVDLFAHTAALRNLNGCTTTFVDSEGRAVEPPAVFTDTLRRGERGELTPEELRMLDEIRSGDYRIMADPIRVKGQQTAGAARGRLPLEEELRVRREWLARLNREAVPRRSSSKPKWWLGEGSSGAGPVITEPFDGAADPTDENTGVRIRKTAKRPVTIRLSRAAYDEIGMQARAHAGELECAGGLYSRYQYTWEGTVSVARANEIAREKTRTSATVYRRDLDRDARPEDGFYLVGSYHCHPEQSTEPSCADVRMWRDELETANERYGQTRQVHLIVAESLDRGWSRPAIAAWSIRLEPWLTHEDRIVLEPATVEIA